MLGASCISKHVFSKEKKVTFTLDHGKRIVHIEDRLVAASKVCRPGSLVRGDGLLDVKTRSQLDSATSVHPRKRQSLARTE